MIDTRTQIERFAMSLYWDHAVKARQKMTPAKRTQSATPPTWPELGTELRNVWRRNALELIQEQRTSFSDSTIREFFQ